MFFSTKIRISEFRRRKYPPVNTPEILSVIEPLTDLWNRSAKITKKSSFLSFFVFFFKTLKLQTSIQRVIEWEVGETLRVILSTMIELIDWRQTFLLAHTQTLKVTTIRFIRHNFAIIFVEIITKCQTFWETFKPRSIFFQIFKVFQSKI